MNSPSESKPPCADKCVAVVRNGFRELGVEANVSWLPPKNDRGYEPLNMRCPHGVLFFAEPSNEQIVQFVREGTA